MHTLAQVVSIWREVHKSETVENIFPKLCTHVYKPFSTHMNQKNNNSQSSSRIERKVRLAYKFFVISGHFDALHGLGFEGLGLASAYYSHKTNILDFELRVGLWNCMSAATQTRHGPGLFFWEIMHNASKLKVIKYETKTLNCSKIMVILNCLALIWCDLGLIGLKSIILCIKKNLS